MHHYCTYFDSRFLLRGVALYESLVQHAQPFVLHVLCLDDAAYDALERMDPDRLRPIRLPELEAAYPALLDAKANRSTVEYYFTCTPALTLYVMEHMAGVDMVTYLDADLYLFDDPTPIYDELCGGSVLIIPHRYPPHLQHMAKFGQYNVGWLTFRCDESGLACLRGWHESCLEWCYERLEEDRYADQKYLDRWPTRFAGVVESSHHGCNLAPWNLANYQLQWRDERVWAGDDPLIFYHFHHLKFVGPHLYDLGLEHYGATVCSVTTRRIYAPYLRHLRKLRHRLPQSTTGNLRLAGPADHRELVRTLLYGHTLFNLGPVATHVHLEPLARPLLKLRDHMRRAA